MFELFPDLPTEIRLKIFDMCPLEIQLELGKTCREFRDEIEIYRRRAILSSCQISLIPKFVWKAISVIILKSPSRIVPITNYRHETIYTYPKYRNNAYKVSNLVGKIVSDELELNISALGFVSHQEPIGIWTFSIQNIDTFDIQGFVEPNNRIYMNVNYHNGYDSKGILDINYRSESDVMIVVKYQSLDYIISTWLNKSNHFYKHGLTTKYRSTGRKLSDELFLHGDRVFTITYIGHEETLPISIQINSPVLGNNAQPINSIFIVDKTSIIQWQDGLIMSFQNNTQEKIEPIKVYSQDQAIGVHVYRNNQTLIEEYWIAGYRYAVIRYEYGYLIQLELKRFDFDVNGFIHFSDKNYFAVRWTNALPDVYFEDTIDIFSLQKLEQSCQCNHPFEDQSQMMENHEQRSSYTSDTSRRSSSEYLDYSSQSIVD